MYDATTLRITGAVVSIVIPVVQFSPVRLALLVAPNANFVSADHAVVV